MSGHSLPKCAITRVLTESFENPRLSSYNTEYLLYYIKHDSHIFIFAIALNFLSDSSALCSSIQPSSWLNILFLLYMPASSWDQLSLISCFGVSEDLVWCHLGLQGNHTAHQSLPKEGQKLNILTCNCIPLILFNLLSAQSTPYNESTDECYSRCPHSLQIMWTFDHIAPEKTGFLLF